MNARPSRARAAARPSFGSLASACTLPARSPSSAAWASADGMGGGSPHVPGAGAWRLLRRPVAAPLALRQHGVGVGLLLEHEPAVPPALGAAAHPVEDPELAQPLQRRGDGADADPGLGGRSPRRTGPAGRCGGSGSRRSARAARPARRGRRRRHAGQAGGCRGRSRGPGARGARRPSWPWGRSGRAAWCCRTRPARGRRWGGRPIRVKLHGKKREHGPDSGDSGLPKGAYVRYPAQDGRLLRAIIACNQNWPRCCPHDRRIARSKLGVQGGGAHCVQYRHRMLIALVKHSAVRPNPATQHCVQYATVQFYAAGPSDP